MLKNATVLSGISHVNDLCTSKYLCSKEASEIELNCQWSLLQALQRQNSYTKKARYIFWVIFY